MTLLLFSCGGGGSGDGGGDGPAEPRRPPDPRSITPSAFLSWTPKSLLLNGYAFGSQGDEVVLRFTAASGAPFLDGTSDTVDLTATVTSENHARVATPFGFCSEETSASVRMIASDGTPSTNALIVHMQPAWKDWGESTPYTYFGTSVAVDGPVALAGGFGDVNLYAIEDEDDNAHPFYKQSGFPGSLNRQFGVAVDRGLNRIYVGDPEAEYLEQLPDGTWVEHQELGLVQARAIDWSGDGGVPWRLGGDLTLLRQSDRHSDCHFGASLACSWGFVIIGAPRKDYDLAVQAGAAYVFTEPPPDGTHREVARLLPFQADDPTRYGGGRNDLFGSAVAMHGESGVAVVGAPFADGAAEDSGAAWVWVRQGEQWVPEQKLTASDGQRNDRFGATVAVEGDTVVVGAPGSQRRAFGAGAAYVFRRSAGRWTEHQRLQPSGDPAGQALGAGIAILRDRVLVGAPGDTNRSTSEAGAVFVFDFEGDGYWHEVGKLVAPDPRPFQAFGASVDFDDTYVIVGAPNDASRGVAYVGAVYIF